MLDRQFENRLKIGLKKCKANFVKFYVNGVSLALGPLEALRPPRSAGVAEVISYAEILTLAKHFAAVSRIIREKAYLSPLERDLRGNVSLGDSSTIVTHQIITDLCLCFTTKYSTSQSS
ncbi:hypothetical protein TNCV_2727431 [Trichonephila clavipes]|nr:hypothetical protein TNCV_2727431 [Trichonephila clavipes]